MSLVDINWRPPDKQLRQFGAISAVALPLLAAWWSRGNPTAIVISAGVGIALATVGWFVPQSLRILFVGLTLISFPIGMVVSELALVAIYLFVFLPIGLVFRLMGRDSMQSKFDRQADSYWRPKRQPLGAKSYYRQS